MPPRVPFTGCTSGCRALFTGVKTNFCCFAAPLSPFFLFFSVFETVFWDIFFLLYFFYFFRTSRKNHPFPFFLSILLPSMEQDACTYTTPFFLHLHLYYSSHIVSLFFFVSFFCSSLLFYPSCIVSLFTIDRRIQIYFSSLAVCKHLSICLFALARCQSFATNNSSI